MAQWHSRYDLAGTTPEKKDSTVTFRNNGKRMVRSDAGTLLLEITTSTEYDKPRTESEPWPHLLIQQDFEVRPNIGKLEKLIFSIDLKLDKCENKMTESQLDPYMHTAQSPLYFVLKNVNSQSPDYNYSIWFGIPSFDYRYTKMTEEPHVAWDKGTSMYMYQCAQLPVWGDISFHDNQWHTANIDILPLIVSAVDTMKIKGNLLETQLSDLELTGMNFGWEIPGTFDAGIFIKNLSLKMKETEPLTETTN